MQRLTKPVLLAFGMIFFAAGALAAQGCGNMCEWCLEYNKKRGSDCGLPECGITYPYLEQCHANGICSGCVSPQEEQVAVGDIARELTNAHSAAQLQAVAARYQERLVLSAEQGTVLITGGCSGHALTAQLQLAPEMIDSLQRGGISSFAEYYGRELLLMWGTRVVEAKTERLTT